ncbi:MAG TPA: hypothetical protein VMQ93_01250 [Novosphingobium sp.]|nr:hypothetical protein [Novosphingobium sp.]
MNWLWALALLLSGAYCIVRAIFDLRRKRYLWGAAGLVAAAIILSAPVPTASVVVDLPAVDRP